VADAYEYATLRVVPDIVRGEFLNAGVVLYCEARGFVATRVALDEARLPAGQAAQLASPDAPDDLPEAQAEHEAAPAEA
jgi:acyl-CoA reductase-like NAD-dependent aldehyde dehydrogenase